MEIKKCPICGAVIQCQYNEPERVYAIKEDGTIFRNDNNDAFQMYPEFEFLCSNDSEHEVYNESEEYFEWRKSFINEVIILMDKENIKYHKMEGL